jgi:Tfp pilus assembly protein PilO
MRGLLLPLLLLGAAIGLFVLYTNPAYQELKSLRTKANSYDEALNKSQELRAVRDQLLSKRNAFPNDSVAKLQKVLPDNVDNIRLIIDIDNIASKHGLALADVDLGNLGDVGGKNGPQSKAAVGAPGDAVGSVSISFSVTAKYEDFLAFLTDLEHSLRLVDVENVSFSAAAADGKSKYALSIRTYWLR